MSAAKLGEAASAVQSALRSASLPEVLWLLRVALEDSGASFHAALVERCRDEVEHVVPKGDRR